MHNTSNKPVKSSTTKNMAAISSNQAVKKSPNYSYMTKTRSSYWFSDVKSSMNNAYK